jgi:hypothetical protein
MGSRFPSHGFITGAFPNTTRLRDLASMKILGLWFSGIALWFNAACTRLEHIEEWSFD